MYFLIFSLFAYLINNQQIPLFKNVLFFFMPLDYSFKDQLQRAAISIMNNIAEGSESGSDAKYINFLKISKGSCSEVRSMLYLCEDFKICTAEDRIKIQEKTRILSSGINNLILKLSNN